MQNQIGKLNNTTLIYKLCRGKHLSLLEKMSIATTNDVFGIDKLSSFIN